MPPKSCAQQQRERQEGLKAGRQYADYQKKQNIIGSGNIKKKLQCLQPRKGRKLNMNANAKLGTGELVCFTLAFTNFLGPDHSLGFLVYLPWSMHSLLYILA